MVDDDAREPGVKALRLAQRAQVPDGGDQRVLHDVLRGGMIARDEVGQARHAVDPPGEQRLLRQHIPGRRPLKERQFLFFHAAPPMHLLRTQSARRRRVSSGTSITIGTSLFNVHK